MSMYLRVSDIIERLKDTHKLPDERKELIYKKGDIGTVVHRAILEGYIDKELIERVREEENKNAERKRAFFLDDIGEARAFCYFESYKIWQKQNEMKVIFQEKRLYDEEYMVTGQIDALFENSSGEQFLIDFKTSDKEAKTIEGMSAWAMQANFYLYLLHKNGYQKKKSAQFLQLRQLKQKDKETGVIWFKTMDPMIYPYEADEKILLRCFEEARAAWEEIED